MILGEEGERMPAGPQPRGYQPNDPNDDNSGYPPQQQYPGGYPAGPPAGPPPAYPSGPGPGAYPGNYPAGPPPYGY